jgi:hypothetical protein
MSRKENFSLIARNLPSHINQSESLAGVLVGNIRFRVSLAIDGGRNTLHHHTIDNHIPHLTLPRTREATNPIVHTHNRLHLQLSLSYALIIQYVSSIARKKISKNLSKFFVAFGMDFA